MGTACVYQVISSTNSKFCYIPNIHICGYWKLILVWHPLLWGWRFSVSLELIGKMLDEVSLLWEHHVGMFSFPVAYIVRTVFWSYSCCLEGYICHIYHILVYGNAVRTTGCPFYINCGIPLLLGKVDTYIHMFKKVCILK